MLGIYMVQHCLANDWQGGQASIHYTTLTNSWCQEPGTAVDTHVRLIAGAEISLFTISGNMYVICA